MKEKTLVVGGTGFIGTHIIKGLSLKKYIIFSLSKKIPKKKKIKGIRYIASDITAFKKLKKKIFLNDFDHVINLSGYVNHSNKKGNFLCHYIGTKNLIDIFKFKKIKSFIQIGSSLEY